MKLNLTIETHIEGPDMSVDKYYRLKCLELGTQVNQKKIVYLDTKFWLILRDASLKRNVTPESEDFYRKAMELANADHLIFPISQDIFIEVIKQTDTTTLNRTIELIDTLSKGTSMINFEERFVLECKHFFLSSTGASLYECQELVWTKVAYNMGFFTHQNSLVNDNIDQALQKSLIDHMWSVTLSELSKDSNKTGNFAKVNRYKSADLLNERKFKYANENKSFKQMCLSEINGALDVYSDLIAGSVADMFEAETGRSVSAEERTNTEFTKPYRNAIYHIFRLNKSQNILPTLRVISGLHAAIRWDKNQKYQDNDLHDIRHAASALPYCDAFFTEKRLAHLIKQKATSYDKRFSCVVEASISDASRALSLL